MGFANVAPIMRLLRQCAVLFALAACWLGGFAAEFKLITGDIYKGTLAAADKDGLIVKLDSGDFSPRVDWAKLTDETLNQLVSDARAKPFVEPFIEPPAQEVQRPEARDIPIRQPQRVERPEVGKGLFAALTTPNSLILLFALYLANLYGAFEIARFKWRPIALVCGLSAILPIIGPLIFLVVPRRHMAEAENATEAAMADKQVTVGSGAAPAGDTPRGGAAAALGISKTGHGNAGPTEGLPKVFKRGETTFNRRFFETQFPSFFRVVTTEADRDLVLDIAAGRNGVVASRISRISANEMHLKTANNQEVTVNFADIVQVTLRHKDPTN
jgi:hypothetical protein